jgi:hypothetical protein
MLGDVSEESEPSSRPQGTPLELISEVLRVVPRFVDRTRSQAEIAASLAVKIPCLGALLGGSAVDDEREAMPAGMHETVGIDVLSLLDDTEPLPNEDQDEDVLTATPPPVRSATSTPPAVSPAVPMEGEMPIPDYDSLAASQVVPRLATLSEDELLAVRSYEKAHRHRQTILNRIAQRLGE